MTAAALEARSLSAGYNNHPVVHDLDLTVRSGEVVALLGPNGAGKTTTMRTLAGALPAVSGETLLLGDRTTDPLHRRAKNGLAFVTEERSVFMGLTTRENLRVGGGDMALALELFPELRPLMGRRAGLLSGGEQQILTVARALSRHPRVLLADELSLGLAPLIVRRLLEAVRRAADEQGVAVLLVEQHVKQILDIADHACVMARGRIQFRGTATEVAARADELAHAYLRVEATGNGLPAAGAV